METDFRLQNHRFIITFCTKEEEGNSRAFFWFHKELTQVPFRKARCQFGWHLPGQDVPHDIPNRNAELEVTGSTLRGPGFNMPTGGTDTECSGLSEDAGTDEIVPSPPLQCPCRPRGGNSPADLLERLAHRAQICQGSGKGRVEFFLTRMGHGTCEAFFPH